MLDQLAAETPSGRLIFGLDATMSRQPTWDTAIELQAQMFAEAAKTGGLEIQPCFYRGGKCKHGKWTTDAERLAQTMRGIECIGGYTQIALVLDHAKREHDKTPISALAFVGDAMEEEIDMLCGAANELASRGIRCFMFQEGADEKVE